MRLSAIPTTLLSVVLLAAMAAPAVAANGGRTLVYQAKLTDPVEPESPPQAYSVVQSIDANGFPAGYSLAFETHVCVDEQCRMVKLTMYWDALGYYERLEFPADLPLTKKKHVPFEAADYAKLDQILKDRDSILGSHPLELLVKPVQEARQAEEVDGIDGWSSATPQTVKDAVVDDAAYTTWTMWRWANGEIVPKLQELTRQLATPKYLQHLLQSDDRREVDFAMKHVLQHHPSDEQFVDDVFHVLETGDREHVSLSLEFLSGAVRDRRQLHDRLIDSCCRMSSNYSPLVVDFFAAQTDLPAETLERLTGSLDRLPYFQIHLILRLLDTKEFFSEKVESNIARLLDHENFFIARRASEHLMKQQLSSDMKRKLDDFQERNRQRL